MTGAVWDQDFFRRRAAGEQAAEPAPVTPVTPEHATIAGLLLARAEDDNTALLFEDQRWSWRELVREAATRSALLQELRPPGRPWHVGVLLENTPEYIFLIAGAALCGATVVGINPTRRGAELAGDIRGTDCAVIVTDEAYGDLLDGIDHGAPRVLDAGGAEYAGLLAAHRGAAGRGDGGGPRSAVRAAPAVHVRVDRGAEGGDLLHRPVGVHLPGQPDRVHRRGRGLQRDADLPRQRADGRARPVPGERLGVRDAAEVLRLRVPARHPPVRRDLLQLRRPVAGLHPGPAGAPGGVGQPAAVRLRHRGLGPGPGRVLAAVRLPAAGVLRLVRGHLLPHLHAGHARRRARRPAAGVHGGDRRTPRGEACPPARFDAGGALLNAEEAIGEIVSRGAAARFEGYYNNPEASRDRLRDGDYWTGDLGYRDEDGFFWFAGRTADWLRVDSENFAAAPVEQILGRFPGVTAAAVYAVPDPVTGDQVMAALEIPGGEFDPGAFGSFLGAQPDLGTKQSPRLIRITASLPETATHKVSKPTLRRLLWHGEDPVYERAGERYVLMTADRKGALEAEYAGHGRDHLLRL